MSAFFSLIIALLLEQVRPLQSDNVIYTSIRSASEALEKNFNAGQSQQGVLAWLLLVLPLSLGSLVIFVLFGKVHPLLAIAWNVGILYLTLGFRQFSHYYTDIQLALADNDLVAARTLLTEWKSVSTPGFSAAELDLTDVCRISIEEALVASHRHVFGVFFWFCVLPGPTGAVLYRLADYLARKWNLPERLRNEPFGRFPVRAFAVIDWIPVRMTAIGFAIVGNFEDAVFCWQNHAPRWDDRFRGIILAIGGGALGVRLGDAHSLHTDALEPDAGPEAIPGVEASPAAMRSAVGLVWRSLILWLILLLLLSTAGLLG